MTDTENSRQPRQDIILDTCILQYLNNKDIKNNLLQYFSSLLANGFTLAISDISIQELLTNATIKQEREGVKTLKKFKNYKIESNILVGAAQLSTLYSKEKNPNKDISVADKLIASTAIITGSLVFTANIHDFPMPFFKVVEEKLFFYNKKGKIQLIIMYVLEPNGKVINQRFSERPKN